MAAQMDPVTVEVVAGEVASSSWGKTQGVDTDSVVAVLEALSLFISDALKLGKNVAIPHFGSFLVSEVKTSIHKRSSPPPSLTPTSPPSSTPSRAPTISLHPYHTARTSANSLRLFF